MPMTKRFPLWPAFALLVAAGCGGDKVSELVEKAKSEASMGAEKVKQAVNEKVNAATTEAQEQLNLAGKMELKLGEPLTTQACYAQFIVQSAPRPNVLQLRSYRQIEQESFPSVFLQAQVSAASAGELVGQTVSAEMYVMREANGAIWRTPAGKSVQVKIGSIDNQLLTAEIVGGALESTDAAGETPVTGSLAAVLAK
jgi:hypothetical protein